MQLDVESLRALLKVLDTGTMTAAGAELGLTQSAVSWKVKRLEAKVGRPLLARSGHSLRPTKDGEELVEYARTLVAVHDEAVARLSSSELTGQVRIGANEEISAARLADLLSRFDRLHPRARIEFWVLQSMTLAQMIDDGELDVAVFQVSAAQLRNADEILWDDELSWAGPAAGLTIGPGDPVPLVSYGADCCYRPLARSALDAAKVPRHHAFSGTSTSSVEAAIASGLGVGVVSRKRLGGDIVEWDPPVDLGALPNMHQIVRHGPGERSPIVDALVAELVSELAQDRQ
jgi:DNA-binding transcriptional LysR family regulator